MLIKIDARTKSIEAKIDGDIARLNRHVDESNDYRPWIRRWMEMERIASRMIIILVVGGVVTLIVWAVRHGVWG